MKAIETVLMIYKGMNDDEKRECIARIGEEAIASGLITEAIGAAGTTPTHKPRRKGRPFLGYWMKSVEGFDETKKGAFRLTGNWVKVPSDEIAEGNLFVIGTKGDASSGKRYILARRESGKKIELNIGGKNYAFADAVKLFESEYWSDVEVQAKAMLKAAA